MLTLTLTLTFMFSNVPPAAADKNLTVFLVKFFSADAIMGGQQGGAPVSGRYGAEPRPHKKNLKT
jgi:hypothetical protein